MNKNMLAILCCIEGLRNLDNWAESDAKKELLRLRENMKPSYERPDVVPDRISKNMRSRVAYADPLGREISLLQWVTCKESCNSHISETIFRFENEEDLDIRVSTVWLGLNHSFFDSTLQIFETMIFGIKDDDELDRYLERYSTIEEAEEGHKKACQLVIEYQKSKENTITSVNV